MQCSGLGNTCVASTEVVLFVVVLLPERMQMLCGGNTFSTIWLSVCAILLKYTKTIKLIFCETCCTGSGKEEEEVWWIFCVDLNDFLTHSEIVSLALADVLVLLLLTLEPVSKCEVNIRIISLLIIITLPMKCITVFGCFSRQLKLLAGEHTGALNDKISVECFS